MCENNEIFTQGSDRRFLLSKKSVKFVKICFRHVIIIRKYRGAYTDNAFCPKHHIDSGERKV